MNYYGSVFSLNPLGNNVPNARFAYKTSQLENTFYFRKASFPIRDSFEAPCRHSLFQPGKKIKTFFHLYEFFLKPLHLLLTINRQNIKIEQQKRILFDLFCYVPVSVVRDSLKGVSFMKIEKINDQQIKCTLTRKELEKRELKLTEIAYGNEKVKTLFRDMMREAELIYGFEADDVPLMIEVIPYSDRVVVLVTKVEEPDELDTRFSRFAPSVIGSNDNIGIGELFDNLLDLNEEGKLDFLPKLAEVLKKGAEKAKTEENSSDESEPAEDVIDEIDENEIVHHFFIFDELSQIIDVAKRIPQRASYDTRVFKNEEKGFYLLRLSAPRGERGGYFFRVYQILSEFGRAPRLGENFSYYVEEHCVPIIESNALQTLRNI